MHIIVGSLNKTKVSAVAGIFPDDIVVAEDVPSGVSAQPIGDVETRQGAIHRANRAYALGNNAGIGIGLEGGVMEIAGELFLNNWGALVYEQGKLYTAAGARIALPVDFKSKIQDGLELSVMMDEFTMKQNIRNEEGAIGIFTNNRIDRTAMFSHIVALLKGQMEYDRSFL
jgi:inosine/xanthosine triphosphatase